MKCYWVGCGSDCVFVSFSRDTDSLIQFAKLHFFPSIQKLDSVWRWGSHLKAYFRRYKLTNTGCYPQRKIVSLMCCENCRPSCVKIWCWSVDIIVYIFKGTEKPISVLGNFDSFWDICPSAVEFVLANFKIYSPCRFEGWTHFWCTKNILQVHIFSPFISALVYETNTPMTTNSSISLQLPICLCMNFGYLCTPTNRNFIRI